jgi:hypothetical protein
VTQAERRARGWVDGWLAGWVQVPTVELFYRCLLSQLDDSSWRYIRRCQQLVELAAADGVGGAGTGLATTHQFQIFLASYLYRDLDTPPGGSSSGGGGGGGSVGGGGSSNSTLTPAESASLEREFRCVDPPLVTAAAAAT